MKSKKSISRSPAGKINGKKGPDDQLQDGKLTVKYTIERTKEDIKKIGKIRKYLEQENNFYKSYKTDSKIYRDLPDLFLNAVKQNQDLQLAIDELTAKLDQLEDLRAAFCRIFELCEVKK